MPAVMRTGQLNQNWVPSQIRDVMMGLFDASGWGPAALVYNSPTDTNPLLELAPWKGATPYFRMNGTSESIIQISCNLGVHKRYRVIQDNSPGANPFWVRDAERWSYFFTAGGPSAFFGASQADPIYMFTLTSDDVRIWCLQHRNNYVCMGFLSLADPAPEWAGKINVLTVQDVSFGTFYAVSGFGPGGAVQRPSTYNDQGNGGTGQYQRAENTYETVPPNGNGLQYFSRQPDEPNNPNVYNNKRQAVQHIPVYNDQAFGGYLPDDVFAVASSGMSPWGQLRTDDGKLLQLLGTAGSRAACWIAE